MNTKKVKFSGNLREEEDVEIDKNMIESITKLVKALNQTSSKPKAQEFGERSFLQSIRKLFEVDEIFDIIKDNIGDIVSEEFDDTIEHIDLCRGSNRCFVRILTFYLPDNGSRFKKEHLDNLLNNTDIVDIVIDTTHDDRLTIAFYISNLEYVQSYYKSKQSRKFDFVPQVVKDEQLISLNPASRHFIKSILSVLTIDKHAKLPLLEHDITDKRTKQNSGTIIVLGPIHLYQLKALYYDIYYESWEFEASKNKTIALHFNVVSLIDSISDINTTLE